MGLRLEIYGQDDCRYCAAAINFCIKRGLSYAYIDLTTNPGRREELAKRVGGVLPPTVPQIFIGAHRIGGFDDLQRSYGVVQQIIGG